MRVYIMKHQAENFGRYPLMNGPSQRERTWSANALRRAADSSQGFYRKMKSGTLPRRNCDQRKWRVKGTRSLDMREIRDVECDSFTLTGPFEYTCSSKKWRT